MANKRHKESIFNSDPRSFLFCATECYSHLTKLQFFKKKKGKKKEKKNRAYSTDLYFYESPNDPSTCPLTIRLNTLWASLWNVAVLSICQNGGPPPPPPPSGPPCPQIQPAWRKMKGNVSVTGGRPSCRVNDKKNELYHRRCCVSWKWCFSVTYSVARESSDPSSAATKRAAVLLRRCIVRRYNKARTAGTSWFVARHLQRDFSSLCLS